jgi:hypothetical protein
MQGMNPIEAFPFDRSTEFIPSRRGVSWETNYAAQVQKNVPTFGVGRDDWTTFVEIAYAS